MKQSKTAGSSKPGEPGVAGRIPKKKKTSHNHTQEIFQNNGHHPDGLDKYFQILPLVENFLSETDPQLKKDNGIFFTPYPAVSFIVRSIHEILKEKLDKPLGLADETVKVLDPAAGTVVFLIVAARLAIDEMARIFGKEKAHTFARRYMLNNLYGIEKEMSLYAVSCLQLAHFFQSLNLRLQACERFHLYWADALENRTGNAPFNVILGNPPYSGHSSNKSKWISEKIKDYYPPKEKNLKWLQDDYVKFIRFAQEKIDENVFDIRQGVAITFFIKKKLRGKGCRVFYSDVWGLRDKKCGFLDSNNFNSINWKRVYPKPDFYLFIPAPHSQMTGLKTCRYQKFFKVTDIFPVHSVGIVTARDRLTIKTDKDEMYRTVKQLSGLDEPAARSLFDLGDDSRDWQVREAQRDILKSGIKPEKVVPILYRPFDTRCTYYTGKSQGFLCMPRPAVMMHMLK
jgi:predicted helicase